MINDNKRPSSYKRYKGNPIKIWVSTSGGVSNIAIIKQATKTYERNFLKWIRIDLLNHASNIIITGTWKHKDKHKLNE